MDNLAAEIAGSRKGKAQAPDKPRKRDLLVERLTDCKKASIIEQYGVYPENHPLTKYVRSLVPETNRDKVAVYVTRAWEEPNAAALPDGTIFVTDRLVKFCRYDEELQFVLQHEIKHITGEHAITAREQEGMDKLGFSRMKEYEADLAEIVADERGCSVNACGAVVFLNRLAEYERAGKAAPGIVHGSTYARLIGVEHAIRLVDMDALSSELHEIPAQVKGTIKHARDPEAQFWSAKKFECMKKAAMKMGFHASLHTLERIYTQEKKLTDAQKGELAGILLQNIQKEARVHF
ncbi:M48 family metalloprotease, partial [Candidatus Micrarchaeota archaeon]|nr:M48 family metalloprotease [Candidatus Micrarchaeota archaeon]